MDIVSQIVYTFYTTNCLNCRDNDITDILDLTFSTDDDRFGEVVSVDLIPNGENIEVTEENKKEYVK